MNEVNNCPACLTFAVAAGTCLYWCLNRGLCNSSPLTSSKSYFGNTSKITAKKDYFSSLTGFLIYSEIVGCLSTNHLICCFFPPSVSIGHEVFASCPLNLLKNFDSVQGKKCC